MTATMTRRASRWPHETSLDDHLRDLQEHARDFAGRRGFTYTVRSAGTGDGDVIGCVYIYPPRRATCLIAAGTDVSGYLGLGVAFALVSASIVRSRVTGATAYVP
jgi:hypothetical protein